jgi:hypothetical protein
MHYIQHRVNTLDALKTLPRDYGAEVDIRYHNNDLILHHDPFHHHEAHPETLTAFLNHWQHEGPLILNVKTEGVERELIALMAKHQVKHWFFLDLSMPFFVKYALHAQRGDIVGFGPQNVAVRYSEYEVLEYALSFAGKAQWVWVDCFTDYPLTPATTSQLKKAGFSICLVSPELQGHGVACISAFQQKVAAFDCEAVCTKRPDLWGDQSCK